MLQGVAIRVTCQGDMSLVVHGCLLGCMCSQAGTVYSSVGLQKSKSAKETLVSIQSMQTDIFQDSGGSVDPMVAFHHDDDKAFRGEAEEYLRGMRVLDTHTGGYNPDSNAPSEVRIGMLKQLFRVALLCATGATCITISCGMQGWYTVI